MTIRYVDACNSQITLPPGELWKNDEDGHRWCHLDKGHEGPHRYFRWAWDDEDAK